MKSYLQAAFVMCCLFPVLTIAQTTSDDSPFVSELIEYLGLTDYSETLGQGGVIHSGLLDDEQLPEEIVAVGAMLLVRGVSPDDVMSAFLDSEVFSEVHNVKRYQAFSQREEASYNFDQLSLSPQLDLTELLDRPLRNYNLSVNEGELLSSIDKSDPQVRYEVEEVVHFILEGRLDDFLSGGVESIVPYQRRRNKITSPSIELNLALQSFSFIDSQFPGFTKVLSKPLNTSSENLNQQFFWLETEVSGDSVWALSTEIRLTQENSAVAADMHFYASRAYNSMLNIVGVLPYKGHSLVFAVNHTFTDKVLGFGSRIKRAVGRRKVAESISRHLEAMRLRLE